jgi:uncharacterized protein
MEFAVNYSAALAGLLRDGRARVERFKCPAWPGLIAAARALRPVYVHFPLNIGAGIGDAMDSETGRPADWDALQRLLDDTGTPLINLHFSPTTVDFPGIPADSLDPAHVALVTERALRDVASVVARFGAERVTVENDPGTPGVTMRACLLPAVIRRVVEESGCGFLFDLSHARLSAPSIGMSVDKYIAALPVGRIREIHLTGIHPLADWRDHFARAGVAESALPVFHGGLIDHLPLTPADWDFTEWAVGQIRQGAWAVPWIMSLECGGVGAFWEASIDDAALYAGQVNRLYALIKEPETLPQSK